MLREYSGNAQATTLAGGISDVATTINITNGTGYPTGATGPFVVTLDAGMAGEEKVLCTSRTGNTLTVSARGWDGTSASSHSNAAPVAHTISATDLREANAFVNNGGTLTAATASSKPLTLKGALGQTADLLELQDSAGADVLSVNVEGRLVYGQATNPTILGGSIATGVNSFNSIRIVVDGTVYRVPFFV